MPEPLDDPSLASYHVMVSHLRNRDTAASVEVDYQIQKLGIRLSESLTTEALRAAVERRYPGQALLLTEVIDEAGASKAIKIELVDETRRRDAEIIMRAREGQLMPEPTQTAALPPLSDVEIANLRKLLKHGGNDLLEHLDEPLIMRLLDFHERTRKLLGKVEWHAGAVAWICPSCAGAQDRGGHKPGCELAALLGRK